MGKSIRSTQKKRFRAEKRRTFGAVQDRLIVRATAATMDVALGRAPRNPDGTVPTPTIGLRLGGAGFFAHDGDTSKGRFAFRKSAPQAGDTVVATPSKSPAIPGSKAQDPIGVIVGATVLPPEPEVDPSAPKPKPGKVRPLEMLPHRANWK